MLIHHVITTSITPQWKDRSFLIRRVVFYIVLRRGGGGGVTNDDLVKELWFMLGKLMMPVVKLGSLELLLM